MCVREKEALNLEQEWARQAKEKKKQCLCVSICAVCFLFSLVQVRWRSTREIFLFFLHNIYNIKRMCMVLWPEASNNGNCFREWERELISTCLAIISFCTSFRACYRHHLTVCMSLSLLLIKHRLNFLLLLILSHTSPGWMGGSLSLSYRIERA